jgi:hypothetical protein
MRGMCPSLLYVTTRSGIIGAKRRLASGAGKGGRGPLLLQLASTVRAGRRSADAAPRAEGHHPSLSAAT